MIARLRQLLETQWSIPAGSSAPSSFKPTKNPLFYSEAANKVWRVANRLVITHPELDEAAIIRLARKRAGVSAMPDGDVRLMAIAVRFLKQGPAGQPNKIGGTPGGPAKASAATHFLPPRGAP